MRAFGIVPWLPAGNSRLFLELAKGKKVEGALTSFLSHFPGALISDSFQVGPFAAGTMVSTP